MMSGTFDSRAQANADSSYLEISLKMQPIWTDRTGRWLYVEQALYSTPDKPYRQRVYQLEEGQRGTFQSRVYELKDPFAYVGGAEEPSMLDGLRLEDLTEREGCAVILRKDESGIYRGSTLDKACGSSLQGASYATSRVSIHSSFIQSWDRGFDAGGQQVWGATEGGYMFLKKN